jgi:hypothetical protein
MKVIQKYPFVALILSTAILVWGLPTPAGAESSPSLQNKAKSSQIPTSVKPKTVPGGVVPPSGVPSFKPPTGLPQGANFPKPKVGPNFGRSIQPVPGGMGLGKDLGQGAIGKRLPEGVSSPHGALGRTEGLKGLPSGPPPGKFSESGKFQESIGPIAGPGTGHSPVQKQDDEEEKKQYEKKMEDAMGKAQDDAEKVAKSTAETAKDKADSVVFTTFKDLAPEKNKDGKTVKSDNCTKGTDCPGDTFGKWRTVEGGDVPDSDKPEDFNQGLLGKATQPKGPLGETVRFVPGEEPSGEGGQPTHIVPSPVMVNPGPQEVDLPPGAFENLNKNLQEKVLSGDKGHIIMDPPKGQ